MVGPLALPRRTDARSKLEKSGVEGGGVEASRGCVGVKRCAQRDEERSRPQIDWRMPKEWTAQPRWEAQE